MKMISSYVSRWNEILQRCKGKDVLHLGCIGTTEGPTAMKLKSMIEKRVLHAKLRGICCDITGIDYDETAVDALRKRGFTEIIYGDVQKLHELGLSKTFDVIVCGDIIEHLDQPSMMLKGIKRFMSNSSEIIITAPNSFGMLSFLRYMFNVFREGNDHFASFSIFTIQNLLNRQGYYIKDNYTCYNHPAINWRDCLRYSVGIPFFRIFPKFGGTLFVVARLR